MATKKGDFRGNVFLWAGLVMVGAAFVLALVGTVFVGRPGSYYGAGGSPSEGRSSSVAGNAEPSEAAGSAENLSEARAAVEQVLQDYGDADLEVAEMMEFANNYYAEVREKSTGIGAMELLVDKPSGRVHPEPGPNMMWNTKYGMMAGGQGMMGSWGPGSGGMMGQGGPGPGMMGGYSQAGPDDEMSVTSEQAIQIANDYLSSISSDDEAGEAEPFYGYYTLHTERDGQITGMLSVNGYTGAVWYHSWHGPFIAMEEEEE